MAKVLVIDDEENNRLLLAALLEHAGHAALEAATGSAGLRMAEQERPDAIIVDLSLPDMTGAELIRQLRANPRIGEAALALYTATSLTPALEELAETYAIRAIIPKPGDPAQILEAVASLLASPR